jgi:hypothetical protein
MEHYLSTKFLLDNDRLHKQITRDTGQQNRRSGRLFGQLLQLQGMLAKEGSIVDATFVAASRGGLPGWQYKKKRIKEATDAKKWVSDILRHTSISYQLERDHNEAEAAFQNGTSTHMINLHYRDLVEDPEASATFWDLTPKEVEPIEIGIDLTGHQMKGWPSDQKLEALAGSKPLTVFAKELDVSGHCDPQAMPITRNQLPL